MTGNFFLALPKTFWQPRGNRRRQKQFNHAGCNVTATATFRRLGFPGAGNPPLGGANRQPTVVR